jgi:Mor family transcriptional regulator
MDLSPLEMFEQIFEYIKQEDVCIEDVLKEFGGARYYIPMYKSIYRDRDIKQEYSALRGDKKMKINYLCKKYQLSYNTIETA